MIKVLIADDDFANRQFLEKLFSFYGTVVTVDNGMAAVDAFAKSVSEDKAFDLICLDIMMPKLDGYQTLETIRTVESKFSPKNKKAKVVMLSALDEDVQDSIRICDDYDAYLCKPIIVEEFEVKMEKLGFTRIHNEG